MAGKDCEGADRRRQAGDAMHTSAQASGLALQYLTGEGEGRVEGEVDPLPGGMRPCVVGALDEGEKRSGQGGRGTGRPRRDEGAVSGGGREAEAYQGARTGGEGGRGSDARVYAACGTRGPGSTRTQGTGAFRCRDLGPFPGLHGGKTLCGGGTDRRGTSDGGGRGLPAFSGTFPGPVGGAGGGGDVSDAASLGGGAGDPGGGAYGGERDKEALCPCGESRSSVLPGPEVAQDKEGPGVRSSRSPRGNRNAGRGHMGTCGSSKVEAGLLRGERGRKEKGR